MAGEVFTPKRIMLRGTIKKLVNLGQAIDGRVDIDTPAEISATGMATQTYAADPPGAYLFECHCGHIRRVVHTETNFRCERGGVGNDCTCPIMWFRKRKESGEVNDEGQPIYVDETVKEVIEDQDPYSGDKIRREVHVPVFYGRLVGEVRAEEMKRRKEAGEPTYINPSPEKTELVLEQKKPTHGVFKAKEA